MSMQNAHQLFISSFATIVVHARASTALGGQQKQKFEKSDASE